MVIWALSACLFVVLAAGSPVRGPDGYGNFGYNYDVKHPGGNSRVRVRTGGDQNRGPYPYKGNAEYISDASYVNPHYVGPPYQPDNYGPHQSNFNHEPPHGRVENRVPVYVEHSKYPKPAGFPPVSSHERFPTYDRSPYGSHPEDHVISQSAVDAGPLYDKSVDTIPVHPAYSNPHFVPQVNHDSAPNYLPNRFEKVPLDPKPTYELVPEKSPVGKVHLFPSKPDVVQQIASDDLPEPSGYPDSKLSQFPLVNDPVPIDNIKSPIDQQVLVDEPEEIPVISQKTLDDKPLLPPSSIVQYMNGDEVSQIAVDAKPYFDITNEPSVVQQASDDGDDHFTDKPPFDSDKSELIGLTQKNIHPTDDDIVIGKSYQSPVIQTAIDEHPSQAVYDSSVEPSFSDTDHHIPSYSYAERPKYRFVPTGPPYERISHSTEIIHGPPRSPYSYSAPPQKHIKSHFPVVKDSPNRYSVKLPPPPPPPVTKSVIQEELPYEQEHIDAGIVLTKNPPVSQSVKLPPPPPAPVTKSVISAGLLHAQEPVDADLILSKNPPISQSVKLPPPPPITKSIIPAELPHAQELVDSDIVLTKNPPVYQSVKLPPPPHVPVTKTVVPVGLPHAQEPVDADLILTKNPPVSQSVKLPPPPITKSVIPAELKSAQEHIDADILLTKNPPISQSIKLPPPPPPPITKAVKPAILTQAQEPVDLILTKNPPLHSVKQPAASFPVYKPRLFQKPIVSIKQPFYGHKSPGPSYVKLPPARPRWSKPQYTQSHFTKTHPASYSIKRPYPSVLSNPNLRYGNPHLKSHSGVKLPQTKTAPISRGVKLPPNIHSVKHPKATVIANGPPIIKTPPLTPPWGAPSSIKRPLSGNPSYPHSVKQPYFAPPSSSYSGSNVEDPNLKYPSYNSPGEKYSPISRAVDGPYSTPTEEFNPHLSPDAPIFENPEEKSPFEKYAPVSHAIRLPSVIPPAPESKLVSPTAVDDKISSVNIVESSPFNKYPPVSHAVRLPSVISATTAVPNLFAAVPSPDSNDDDAVSASLQNQHAPVSHSIILPVSEPKVSALRSEALSSPISHSVRLAHPIHGSSGRGYRVDENLDEHRQEFPAFPVESAFKQRDPVSEKVADLSNSFNPGAGYINSNREPEGNDSPSTNDAKAEVDRINREIGVSFGDRISRRSRYS